MYKEHQIKKFKFKLFIALQNNRGIADVQVIQDETDRQTSK
jgi:hypothetical protein